MNVEQCQIAADPQTNPIDLSSELSARFTNGDQTAVQLIQIKSDLAVQLIQINLICSLIHRSN